MSRMSDIKYPKGEIVWVCYNNRDGETRFIVTSKGLDRSAYFLYEIQQDGACKKLGKSRSPIDLEKKFKVLEAVSA